jgi:spore germination protein YaaH
MIGSLIANGYYAERSGNVITLREYTVTPRIEQGALHCEFIDTAGNMHNIWASTPDTLSAELDLVPEYSLSGIAAWAYSFGNAAAWEAIKRKLGEQPALEAGAGGVGS